MATDGGYRMDSIQEQFEFLDFQPNLELRGLASQILSEILGYAPSDASSVARVVRTRDGFEATVKINSLAGTFAACTADSDAKEAVQSLSDRILDQLGRWRQMRLRREAMPALTA